MNLGGRGSNTEVVGGEKNWSDIDVVLLYVLKNKRRNIP